MKINKHFAFLVKLQSIINYKQKKQLLFLFIMMLIGMIFEMLGLGILIPILGYMSNPSSLEGYQFLRKYNHIIDFNNQTKIIYLSMTLLVIFYIIKSVYLMILTFKQNNFISNLSEYVSEKLFTGYLNSNYLFHLNSNSTILSSNVTHEVAQLTQLTQALLAFFVEFSVVFGIFSVIVYVEPIGALTVSFFLLISTVLFYKFTKKKLGYWGIRRQENLGLMYKNLAQGLSGIKDVKILGKEEHFKNEFKKPNSIFFQTQTKVNTLAQVPRYYLELVAVIGLAVLTFVMLIKGNKSNLIIPTLGVFMASAFRMIPSVNRIMAALQQIKFSEPAIDLIYKEFNLLDKNIKLTTELNKLNKLNFEKEIDIKNIHFGFNKEKKIIKNISFKIKKGQTIGIIGESGSGKSTLADIILGLLTPDEGEIEIDGTNISSNLRIWQNEIGYVSQSIYLIDDTLKRNIAFGFEDNDIDYELLWKAIDSSNLTEYINSLPDGLETYVGERGVRLSGGQRQRIGIARAIYNNPEILILDEATSSLDIKTEKVVMESINNMKGKKTIIIIAHRLSTIENCDFIIRVDKGKILAIGKPEDILYKK